MSDVPERIVPSCVEALESYQQADMDGVMVLVSRQAIHETIDAYWARVKTCEELEAKLAEALEIDMIEQAISDVMSEGGTYRDAAEYVARTALAELKGKDDDQ